MTHDVAYIASPALAACVLACGAPSSVDGLPPDVDFEIVASILIDERIGVEQHLGADFPIVLLLNAGVACDEILERGLAISGDGMADRAVAIYLHRPGALGQELRDGVTITWTEPQLSAIEFNLEPTDSGEIALTRYSKGESASGKFSAVFRGAEIRGSFDADWCCRPTPGALCSRE